MLTQRARREMLHGALSRAMPDSWTWRQPGPAEQPASAEDVEYWTEIVSSIRADVQVLRIVLRPDGDVQVEYHVPGEQGSPFESLFPLVEGHESKTLDSVAAFVAALLSERLVLVYAKGLWRGGRRFIPPADLTDAVRHELD